MASQRGVSGSSGPGLGAQRCKPPTKSDEIGEILYMLYTYIERERERERERFFHFFQKNVKYTKIIIIIIDK